MRFLYLLILLFLVTNCQSPNENTQEKNQEPTVKHEFKDSVCYCSRLILDEPYNHFYHELNDRTIPFTGICRDSFPDGTLKIEKHLKDGKNHGEYKTYYENGQLKSWKKFNMNYEVEGKNYFPSGVLKHHAIYKGGKVKKIIYSSKIDSTVDYSSQH